MNICIIGTGYVGMASAIGLAELGCTVVGYDIDPARVAGLQRGEAPYREAQVDTLLARHLRRGRLRFTADHTDAVRGASLILVSVGTPARPDGAADLSALWACVEALRRSDLSACEAVVIRSTIPPGTCDAIAAALAGRAEVIYAPEFLREGSAIADFLAPDRIVVGGDRLAALVAYAKLFEPLDAPVVLTTRRNAELMKVAANVFLAMKISFANEIANLCDALGADADDVLRGVGADRRIGAAFLAPGIGFGGPCFEKDCLSLRAIAEHSRTPAELVGATLRTNESQPRRIVATAAEELGGLEGRRIAVWGLTFKAGTDDVRDSLAMRIVAELGERGATVRAHDPAVRAVTLPRQATLHAHPLDALDGADALLVLTEWPEFGRIAPHAIAAALRAGLVVDGRNVLDGERLAQAGLRYRGVGRRAERERPALPVAI